MGAVVFQALQYKYLDCNLTSDDDGEDDQANLTDWQASLHATKRSQIVHIIYGSEQETGKSVSIGVLNARPSLSLRLDDISIQTINDPSTDWDAILSTVKTKVRSVVSHIFGDNTFHRALESHVLVDAIVIEWRKSIYFFQEHKSPFIKLHFQTAASYEHMKRILTYVATVQKNRDINDVALQDAIDKVQLRLKRHNDAKSAKSKKLLFDKNALLSKNQLENLAAKKDDYITIQIARAKSKHLHEDVKTLVWGLFDGKTDPTVALLKSLDCRKQWFEVDIDALNRLGLHSRVEEEGMLALTGVYAGAIDVANLKVRNDISGIAPFMQCAFDIEAYSGYYVLDENQEKKRNPDGSFQREFPIPSKPKNDCFQISMNFHRFGQPHETARQHLLTLGDPDPLPQESETQLPHERITVHRCESEKNLLLLFFKLVDQYDVDVFLSFNGDGFDWQYIYHRAVRHGLIFEQRKKFVNELDVANGSQYENNVIGGEASRLLTRAPGQHINLKHSIFSSGAAGTTQYQRLVIPGRLHIDLLKYVRDNDKLPK